QRPVVLDRFGVIATDEGVDDAHVEPRGGADYFLQVFDDDATVVGVGVQRVGVEAEPGDGDAVFLDQVADAGGVGVGEARDVHVADTGVTPVGGAGRPAHQLDAAEALV